MLLTPRVDRCGVAGIVREVVLEAAAAARIPVAERGLDEGDLADAEELVLTSSLIGIRPVRELDGRPLEAGPVTRRLQAHLAPLLGAGVDATGHAASSGGGSGG